ncbi:hypothetical protein FB45DRAFT_1068936 [Roridomyces roridus]|uniref:Beta-cyclopiazonate dehydrogenase n=1 Tax=Roridomyces roridus TaxID=1738132 RepID=A0AAD7B020_9AGAR|nr:hypothetical protein FB45DRAFT_1068936 [Roridomyces roridus]
MATSLPLLLLVSTLCLVHALPEHYTTISRDVVVIGGGSSGTYAAVNLKARGHTVAVLEQQNRLGGHVETYIDPSTGQPSNLGVIDLYNNSVNNAYFSLLGVPIRAVPPATTQNAFLDFATGKPVPAYDPNTPFLPALEAYLAYITETYPYLSLSYENLTYPVPAELLEPFTVFAARHNFTAILQLFNGIAENIGNLWQLPTYHGIHALDPHIITAILTGFVNAASGNNQDIYNAAERFLGSQNVFLNSTITAVDRSGSCFHLPEPAAVCVLSRAGSTTTLTKARKLLVSIPTTLASLASASIDLDTHERAVFSHFTGFTYGVAVVEAPHLDGNTSYNNIGTHTPDNLLSLPGAFAITPIEPHVGKGGKFSAWFGAVEGTGWTPERVEKLVAGDVVHIGGGSTAEVTFDFLKIHVPFRLHVPPAAVAGGFYKELYALEGRKNTFWTGAAWAEQDSSQIWMWSEVSLLPKMLAALA